MQPTLFTCNDVSATWKLILDGGQDHPSAKGKTVLQLKGIRHSVRVGVAERHQSKSATALVVLKTCRVILGKLKSNLKPRLNSSLIFFFFILMPNKELVGFLASLSLQIPWPEEVSMPIMLSCCPCAPQSDCYLDEDMLGINLHYIFMDADYLIILY